MALITTYDQVFQIVTDLIGNATKTISLPNNNPPVNNSTPPTNAVSSTIQSAVTSVNLKDFEVVNEGNGPGCPPLKGKLKGEIITSKIKNAYGGFAKGNKQFINRLEIAYDNFLTKIKTLDKPLVGDSYRSFSTQKSAYDTWVNGGKKGPTKASPCKGYHVAGQAIDLNQGGKYTTTSGKTISFLTDITSHGILYKALYDAGLRRVSNEWWHWSIGETNHVINKKFEAHTGSPGDVNNYTQY